MRRIITLAALTIFLSGCLKDGTLKLSNSGYQPKVLSDGLEVTTPELQSVDTKILKQAYDDFYSNKYPLSKGLIVMRNGKLIGEAYAQDLNDIHKIDNIQSCTKSITALLIGAAIDDKLIGSVQDPLYKYIPDAFDSDVKKRKISLRNCLTLQAGLAFGGNSDSEKMVNYDGSSLKYILEKPMVADTGAVFLYSDFVPQLLSGVLTKATGSGAEVYAKKKIFDPLGINTYKWETTKDGINIGAFSLFLTTRDLAKLGQLCLQKGKWNNVSLISSEWIESVSRKQSVNGSYGYGFYVDQATGAFTMRGNGGQFVYIYPAKNLIIAFTAAPYTDQELWGNSTTLINKIIEACK